MSIMDYLLQVPEDASISNQVYISVLLPYLLYLMKPDKAF